VEDDYFAASETESQLIEAGFVVVGVAASADRAIELARTLRPELAIMDIRLIGPKDGIEAAIELLRIGIPSVFATAHVDDETRRRATIANPLGWLEKPYSAEKLIVTLNGVFAPD
jgi:DNA-binding NarL/FixJ family response regulator